MDTGLFPPLRLDQRTLSEQVYRLLLEAIVERRFKPGERLLLDELADQLKVSRTPVRDALARLAAEGLVEPLDRRGVRVAVLSADDLGQLYDLRLMCELYGVEKGLANLTDPLLGQMEAAEAECRRLHGSPDPSLRLATYLKDEELHRAIVGLARNPRLEDFYRRLNLSVQALRVGPTPIPPDQMQAVSHREHTAILAALRDRDLIRAKEAIRVHVTGALERTLLSLELSRREAV